MEVTIDEKKAMRAGYISPVHANRAGRRAIRWLKVPANNGATPPRGIQQKIDILKVNLDE